MKKISELSDISKAQRQDKEKKDALANIDINNFASKILFIFQCNMYNKFLNSMLNLFGELFSTQKRVAL
jgi:hypothetical protein